jgi:cytochrome d ubiquinol oxidase subunit II
MTEYFSLEFLWFIIIISLLTGFVVLDGFDFGVGMFHLFSKKDEERRIMLNAIGPVWDGNEVWLVTAGGAIFAGFPHAYATLCSAFYIPLMILLSGLIFRAVAIEFRSKQPMAWWRWFWDILFSAASLIISLGLGFVMGNLIAGIPLDPYKEFSGRFLDLIHPYSILVGLFTTTIFAVHGLIYILMKTEGELHDRLRRWVSPSISFFIAFYILTTTATLIFYPHMRTAMEARPLLYFVAVINAFAVGNILWQSLRGRDGWAFISSCVNLVCLMVLYATGTYPNLVRAINDPENLSLTLQSAASSPKTLGILLLMVVMGLPLVAGYTFAIYWVFRGKVKLHSTSY